MRQEKTEFMDCSILNHSLSAFIAKSFAAIAPGQAFLPNWHIDVIAEYLEAVRCGDVQRLMINMPPRALKSVCVSVAWPAWLLGHNPSYRIMAASYAQSLANKHSLDCRLVMQSEWYRELFPQTVLSAQQNEKHKFMTTRQGMRLATSIGGTVTGEGGDILIADDPINALQANRAGARQRVNEWFEHSFSTRLDNKKKGAIVVVMQRLHAADLSGFLLEKGGWEHVCLPALSTERQQWVVGGHSFVRAAHSVLHAGREDEAMVQRAKSELGSAHFSAQYQQKPVPQEGGMVSLRWFGRFDLSGVVEGGEHARVVQSWDTAIKSGDQHDASVCVSVLQYEDGRHEVLDVWCGRLEYPELKRRLVRLAERYRPSAILIEDKASGQSLLQDIRREGNLPAIAIMPKHDKVTRFAQVTPMIEAGKVFLPRNAAWLADFEHELLSFPMGVHDDQVDAFSQYLNWVRQKQWEDIRLRTV